MSPGEEAFVATAGGQRWRTFFQTLPSVTVLRRFFPSIKCKVFPALFTTVHLRSQRFSFFQRHFSLFFPFLIFSNKIFVISYRECHSIHQIFFFCFFFCFFRPEFFLLMTHKQMLNMQAGGTECSFTSMRWISIALQSFFDITVLQSVSRHDLLPPLPTSANKFDESWSLVRLTAKRDLPQQLDWSVLAEYVFFVNQAMSSRRKPIISWFER